MLAFEEINNPLAEESLVIQEAILNSDQYFLQKAEGKTVLTSDAIIEEIIENMAYDAKFSFIKNGEDYLGLVYYILDKPHEHYCWLSLFILHQKFQNTGFGFKSYQLLEDTLKTQYSIEKIILCAQVENKRGIQFWQRNGYKKVDTTWDKKQLLIDIFEKTL